MNILLQPETLSLTGAMNNFEIYATGDVTFVLQDTETGKIVVQHTYTPNENHRITLQLKDVIEPLLSFKVSDTSDAYSQPLLFRTYKATFTEVGTVTPKSVSFSVIRAGVDQTNDTASNFLKTNFLTWQPTVKAVTYYSPEFLTYCAQEDCVMKCKTYVWNGTGYEDEEMVLATLNAGDVWTVPVQYAIIAKKMNGSSLPSYYDVWVEGTDGTRFTYVQRYYAGDPKSENEEWFLFENSLGGIDCFRAYGNSENTAEHTHNVAEIEEDSEEYRVDTTRKFKKHTGYLDERERQWLLDFFPSLGKYHYCRQSLRRIVVTESDVNYEAKELPTDYSFTYKYADARPYLNLKRTDVKLTEMDIHVPDLGNFTIAPRLVEFPRQTLSDGALFPVQSPYSEEWGTTTFSAIFKQIVASMASSYTGGGGIGHTHANFDLLDSLSYFGDYILWLGKKLNAGYADKAGELSDDSKVWQKFLRKDLISADHWEEVLGKVKFLNDVEFTKGVTFKDAVKFLATITSTDINNSGTIKTKNLEVTGLAHFFELIIDKIKSAGGAALFTPADGFDADIVEEIEGGYRLYWRCQDGNGNQRDNMWMAGDQALCMSFNKAKVGTSHDVANKYYWALVTGVSEVADPIEKDGEYYNYIEISSSDCDGTVNPEKGDSIVMLGYRGTNDKARQSAIYISAYTSLDKGLTAPAFAQYRGINDFDLASHRKSYWDAKGSKVVGKFEMESGESLDDYIKDNTATTAVYQIEVDGMFRVDKDGNFTGTNYFQDRKDIRQVGLTLYRMKGDTKEAVGDGDYYMVVDPYSDGVYLYQSPQGHSSNLLYIKQSGLAKVPSYITVKVYNLATDETTHAPIPGKTLYASTTIPILRDGTAGKDGADGAPGKDGVDGKDGADGAPGKDGVDGKDGKGIVAAYKYSDGTPSKPTATKNETNLGGGWFNAVPTVAPQWNGWSLDKDTAPDGDRWWYKSPSGIGNSERTSFKCVFNTTSDNQEVNFYLYSSSEKGWDYVYISEVDATEVPSKPGMSSTGKVSNGTSGVYATDSNGSVTYTPFLQITKTIAKKGTHTIYVCYAKDGSGSSGSDCGWFAMDGSVSFTASTPDVLWQSNGVLEGETITSWTDPFRVTGKDGKQGEDGNDGKGALEVLVSPETLVFDTEDDGIVLSSTSKTASIACYRDGALEVNVSYGFQDANNCKGNVNDNKNGTATVTVSNIAAQVIDSGTSVSVTSGYVEVLVWDKVTDLNHYIHVPFTVNVSKYTGKMLADNKKFKTDYTEITNNYKNLPLKTQSDLTEYTSSIEQTAREISLKVSEKAVGRRNMLPESALRKQEDGVECQLYGDFIDRTTNSSSYQKGYYGDQGILMNDGVSGSNCFKCKCYYLDSWGESYQYPGLFWRGGDGSKNIKIEKGKKYIISVWAKCSSKDLNINIECIYKPSENANNSQRNEQITLKRNKARVDNANTWELFTAVMVPDDSKIDAGYNYTEVNFHISHRTSGQMVTAYFCRPMMEEGEEYNGWTLSEEDYDYIGGNLLDNASTLDVSGNLKWSDTDVELVENGFEDGVNARHIKVSSGHKALAQWGHTNDPVGLQPNTDYVFSFWAKGTSLIAYAYRGNNDAEMVKEDCLGAIKNSTGYGDGNTAITLTGQWKRYWIHWRTKSRTEKIPQMILLRTYTEAWIAKPKLEIGCTMTDWTEKRTDMVDKQALLATGIDIANKKVTITADNTVVQNNNGEKIALLNSNNGYINTSLLNVEHIYLKNQSSTVYGHFGFSDATGGTDQSGYKYPLWIGAATAKDANFAVREDGAVYATKGKIGPLDMDEIGLYIHPLNINNTLRKGADFRSGGFWISQDNNDCNNELMVGRLCWWDPLNANKRNTYTTTTLGSAETYNASVIVAKKWNSDSSGDSRVDPSVPALMVESKGVGITSFALNYLGGMAMGCIRESQIIGDTLKAMHLNRISMVVMTNSSTYTFPLPKTPVKGQLLIVVQGNARIDFATSGKSIYCGGSIKNDSNKFYSGTVGQFNIFLYDGYYWQLQFINSKA